MRKINQKILILVNIILIEVLILILFNSKAGLWEICNPQTNNCKEGLVCKKQGVTDIYRCIMYLKEGEECGIDVAKICGKGLVCTDTNETRNRCGTFSTEGYQKCFVEPFQVCKSL